MARPRSVKQFCIARYNKSVDDYSPSPATPDVSRKRGGRPRAFDRGRALELALELLWRHGFEGTSTAQLTAAMGISPPSLYAAFGSKEALFREALALYGQRYGGFLTQPMSAPGSARDAVEQMLHRAARQFTDARHPTGCMVAAGELQTSAAQAPLAQEVAALRLGAQKLIHDRLKRAVREGELPAESDIATLAAFLAMTVQGMAVQARDGARPALLKRLADLALRAWPTASGAD